MPKKQLVTKAKQPGLQTDAAQEKETECPSRDLNPGQLILIVWVTGAKPCAARLPEREEGRGRWGETMRKKGNEKSHMATLCKTCVHKL